MVEIGCCLNAEVCGNGWLKLVVVRMLKCAEVCGNWLLLKCAEMVG